MNFLQGCAWLLVCQSLGELVARGTGLGLPGPVIGMVLLLVALNVAAIRTPVAAAADALLGHLSLLFVPVGVGVMAHLGLISEFGLRLLVVLVVSTLMGVAVTAVLLRWLWRRAG